MGLFGNKGKAPKLNDNAERVIASWEREKNIVKATHGNLEAFKTLELQLFAHIAEMRVRGGSAILEIKQGNEIINQILALKSRPVANGRPVRVEPKDFEV